ncbi:Cryparin [Beauveria bassiana]|uniref:Cryparin n=1 Tax=Beauveria bassiana TaxID=176275 RepID=A0A2N6NBV0_BEABA|nr:Cryparin [Beauveria bassiana]
MKFFAIAALFAGALAMPTAEIEARTYTDKTICPNGLYSNLVCADVNILGVACLDADTPPETPRDGRNFQEICAKIGKQARCAAVPVLGQALLCIKPVGVQ